MSWRWKNLQLLNVIYKFVTWNNTKEWHIIYLKLIFMLPNTLFCWVNNASQYGNNNYRNILAMFKIGSKGNSCIYKHPTARQTVCTEYSLSTPDVHWIFLINTRHIPHLHSTCTEYSLSTPDEHWIFLINTRRALNIPYLLRVVYLLSCKKMNIEIKNIYIKNEIELTISENSFILYLTAHFFKYFMIKYYFQCRL